MSTLANGLHKQSGVTLVELIVVILVISIVAALALMQRGSANEQFQRQNVARELKVAFERARFDSVKRRADGTTLSPYAYVELTASSFTLRIYTNEANGAATAQDQVYTFPTGITAEGYQFALGASRRVEFNRRGEASILSDDPRFMICNGTCPTAPGNSAVSSTVLVTPTGTVNLLAGGVSIPSFTNPGNIATVSNTSGIRQDVVMP